MKINKDILLASIGFSLVFFGFIAAQQFVIPFFSNIGAVNIGLFSVLIVYAAFAVFSLISPKIISGLGSRKAFVVSGILYSFYIFSIFLRDEYVLYLFSFLLGIGAAIIWTNIGSYIIGLSSKKERGEALGFQTSIYIFGSLLGIFVSTVLIGFVEIELIFLILAIFSFSSIIPFLLIKDIKAKPEGRGLLDVCKIFANRKILFLLPAVAFTFFIGGQMVGSVGLMLKNFGLQYVGLVGIILYLVMLLISYPLGFLTKKFKKQAILLATSVLCLIGLVIFVAQISLFMSMVGVVLMSVFIATAFPVSLNLMKDISTNDTETVAGAFALVNGISALLSFLSTTVLKEIISLNLSVAINVAAIFFILLLWREL